MLNEAYHASLIQMIYEKVGYYNVKQWRVKPEQSDLLELMKYMEEPGINLGMAQHEFMANNMDILMNGMKQFVAKHYPDTYKSVYLGGKGDEAFYSLCLSGLEDTKFYIKYVADRKITPNQFNAYRNQFATHESETCND